MYITLHSPQSVRDKSGFSIVSFRNGTSKQKALRIALEPMSQNMRHTLKSTSRSGQTLYDAQLPILQSRATEKYFQGWSSVVLNEKIR